MTQIALLESARRTIVMERDAISALLARLDEHFERACGLMLACQGRVVVTGTGKSGHIGNKIAATLARTGTPAMCAPPADATHRHRRTGVVPGMGKSGHLRNKLAAPRASTGPPAMFLHPAEASDGDVGMITPQDVVLALSNAGTTAEVIQLLPLLKRMGVPLISLTGNRSSTLALAADVDLDISVAEEACPLGLAPTSSTTASLVMGDALAIAMLEARGFTAEDFACSHPGGALGRRLLLKVSDVMHEGDAIPRVGPDQHIVAALLEMSAKGMGFTTVVDGEDRLLVLFTDGDLRRTIDQSLDVQGT